MISPAVEGHSNHPNNSTACHHIATLGWKTGVEKDHLFPHSLLLSDTRTARKLTLSYSTLQVLVMTFQVAKRADLLGPQVQLAVGLFGMPDTGAAVTSAAAVWYVLQAAAKNR